MNDYGGFLFIIDEPQRAQVIKERIEIDSVFTDTLSAPDWKARKSEIFLISLAEGYIHFAALAHRGKHVATEKYHIEFSNIVQFGPPVSINEIQEGLRPRIKQYFMRSSSGIGGSIPPATWHDLIGVIKQLRPNAAQDLDRLEELRSISPDYFSKPGFEIVAHERDVVNIALRISGLNPKEITKWLPVEESTAPFLRGLGSVKLNEDQMIANDAQVFGDWERIMECQVGTVEFGHGTERLTIMNVNRHSIEHTFGVDLLYYFHKHRSYVMVQYKRMRKDGNENEYGYRPRGETYEDELIRMRSFAESLNSNQVHVSPSDYRFHPGMFYFKICPAEIFEPTSTEMIRGMYLPLDYWILLMDSQNILGPKRGKRITFNNVEKHFSNTLFIDLVQAGWVGSQVTDHVLITEVIQASLEGRNSVILASYM